MENLRRRVLVSFSALLLVLTGGTAGYWLLGSSRWGWDVADCVYMTLVTVTTLGIEALPHYDETPGARLFTSLLLVTGIGTFLYFASSLTALLLEGDLQHAFRRKRMQKLVDTLQDHVIVCGVGQTGRHVVKEMLATRTPFVAVDVSEANLQELAGAGRDARFPYLVGDATSDEMLQRAGVRRARALVAALTDDKDNLYLVVSAREANAKLRIVARAIGQRAPGILEKAGADAVISTNQLGGMRLANEVLRPHVTEFLEEMLRERHINLRIEEVSVPPGSPLVGCMLRDAHIRAHTGALVLAVRDISTRAWNYNPGPEERLQSGTVLIVLLPVDALPLLRRGIVEGFDAPAAAS